MCACAISAECAARRGNFEITKEPQLISQQRKVIFKKQVYHSDQYKNWTSMICFVAYSKNCVVLPFKSRGGATYAKAKDSFSRQNSSAHSSATLPHS